MYFSFASVFEPRGSSSILVKEALEGVEGELCTPESCDASDGGYSFCVGRSEPRKYLNNVSTQLC